MKKILKLTSLVMILVTVLGLSSGCFHTDTMTTLTFGVPYAEDSDEYQAIQLGVEDINLFKESDFVQIKLLSIPEDADGRKAFLKKVKSGSVAFFFYNRDEYLDPYIEDGTLASIVEIQKVYPSCWERRKQFVLDTSVDSDGTNHLLALKGNYQGVFFNEELFIKNGVKIPKTWDQFKAAIETFKAAGVTPIAGGFADGGLTYWMDELILMEGGVAEHSYVPKYGVVNSWSRAMADIKSLVEMGAFNANCMSTTEEQAEQMFANGEAAMIVSASKRIATDDTDVDGLGVFSLPVAATGKKNIGDIICDYDTGVYINSQFLNRRTEIIDTMIEFVVDYLDKPVDPSMGVEVTPDWSYPAYKSNWSLPGNPYTIEEEPIVEDNEYVSPEDVEEVDPTLESDVVADDTLDNRVFDMMEGVTQAGRSLRTEFLTFDYFIDLCRNYIEKGGDVEAMLSDATAKEVAAQNGDTEVPTENAEAPAE